MVVGGGRSCVDQRRFVVTQRLAALGNCLLQALANRAAIALGVAAGGKGRLIRRHALGCLPGINPDKGLLAVQSSNVHPVLPDRDALGPEPLGQLQGCHLLRQRLLLLLASAVLDELALYAQTQQRSLDGCARALGLPSLG